MSGLKCFYVSLLVNKYLSYPFLNLNEQSYSMHYATTIFYHFITGCQIVAKSDITDKKFSSVLSKFLKDDLLPTASYQPLIIDCGNMGCQFSKSGIHKYHMRAIISRSLYIFYLIFEKHFFSFFKEVFS